MLQREGLDRALRLLTDRERKVIELRYGLADAEPQTLEQIGQDLGITRERVRQDRDELAPQAQAAPAGPVAPRTTPIGPRSGRGQLRLAGAGSAA
ncbi:MAG: sigma factor-like helix-turn-helix DNA-binding protein [Gaiellales bacterium]